MGVRSPSKYCSLAFLQKIKEQYYSNLDKGVDYIPSLVDRIISEKLYRLSQQNIKRQHHRRCLEEAEFNRLERVKPCTKCYETLPFSHFHKDSLKKTYGLRSWCKNCRKKRG